MVTRIYLRRWGLITKEEMESNCKGEKRVKDSVNDDLESFFENIQLGKEPDEYVETYFLPKLTEEELELVERRERSYLQTFFDKLSVDETQMMLSESDSKYVRGICWRRTFVIENSFKKLLNYLKNKCSLQIVLFILLYYIVLFILLYYFILLINTTFWKVLESIGKYWMKLK